MNDERKFLMKLIVGGVLFLIVLVTLWMWGMPHYHVYSNRLDGEASLAKAESSKQVMVQEAKAKLDSATLLADADIARAKGVAEANRIIGDSLKNNEAYLRYLFIEKLDNTQNQVIYIPTEANLPILESRRLAK